MVSSNQCSMLCCALSKSPFTLLTNARRAVFTSPGGNAFMPSTRLSRVIGAGDGGASLSP